MPPNKNYIAEKTLSELREMAAGMPPGPDKEFFLQSARDLEKLIRESKARVVRSTCEKPYMTEKEAAEATAAVFTKLGVGERR